MSRNLGSVAEKEALCFLQQHGFNLILKNFLTPLGEIDLIGQMGKIVVFVEVKARRSIEFGVPLEMVTRAKQLKIRKTAQIFLQQHPRYQSSECRFDVIGITSGKIEWIKAAF